MSSSLFACLQPPTLLHQLDPLSLWVMSILNCILSHWILDSGCMKRIHDLWDWTLDSRYWFMHCTQGHKSLFPHLCQELHFADGAGACAYFPAQLSTYANFSPSVSLAKCVCLWATGAPGLNSAISPACGSAEWMFINEAETPFVIFTSRWSISTKDEAVSWIPEVCLVATGLAFKRT